MCAGCDCRLRRLFAAQTWLSLAGLWSGSACDHRLPPVMSRSAPARAVGSTQRRLELARRLRRRGRLCQRPLVPGQPCHGISCQIFSLALWPLVGPIATGYRRLPLRVLVSVAPTRGPAMWCSPSSAVASPGVAPPRPTFLKNALAVRALRGRRVTNKRCVLYGAAASRISGACSTGPPRHNSNFCFGKLIFVLVLHKTLKRQCF